MRVRYEDGGARCMLLLLLVLSDAACGKIGYDATALDEPELADGSADAEIPARHDGSVGADAASRPEEAGRADAGPTCSSVSMIEPVVTDRQGGSQPGYDVNDMCPPGQAIIGYTGRVSTDSVVTVGTTRALCGQIAFDPATCAVRVVARATLPERGTVGTRPYRQTCPQDQVVVGIRGRSGTRVDQVSMRCASLVVSDVDPARLVTASSSWLPASGGDGGNAFEFGCPDDRVVYGYGVRVDRVAKLVETIWLYCGSPELTP